MTPPDSHELAQTETHPAAQRPGANLEEVLHNQAHPNDLAAVRKAGTPVFAKPVEPVTCSFVRTPKRIQGA